MHIGNFLNDWLAYSIRRRLLDSHLKEMVNWMGGHVLEIGNGHKKRRGQFHPPATEARMWVYLDIKEDMQPHLAADVEYLPLKDNVFNLVLCLEVMEYVDEFQTALKEIHRVLKPGGILILSTPFLHRVDNTHDYWRFTEHALRHLLAKTGFIVQELKAQGGGLAVAANILKYAIYAIQTNTWRQIAGLVFYLPLMILFWLDSWSVRRLPVLRTFSTGYLVLARRC